MNRVPSPWRRFPTAMPGRNAEGEGEPPRNRSPRERQAPAWRGYSPPPNRTSAFAAAHKVPLGPTAIPTPKPRSLEPGLRRGTCQAPCHRLPVTPHRHSAAVGRATPAQRPDPKHPGTKKPTPPHPSRNKNPCHSDSIGWPHRSSRLAAPIVSWLIFSMLRVLRQRSKNIFKISKIWFDSPPRFLLTV
jgi:hypothetical protein